MKLIVGLGNPGEKYQATRHNLGFMVVENFLKDFEPVEKKVWENSAKFKSDIAELEWQRRSSHGSSGQALNEKIFLVKPKTYMNNSGMAVQLISSFYKIRSEDIWIIHDDFDLPLGSMKIRFGGASAGHHGVESIISTLKTDKFWRFRLGTGVGFGRELTAKSDRGKGTDFVLGSFGRGESGKIRELIKRGVKALEAALEQGLEKAQHRFNTK